MSKIESDLHLNEFFVEGGDQKKSHVLLHITEPSTPEEKAKGYFFAICETNNADNDTILNIQNIIDQIENKYYEAPNDNAAMVFEKILEQINEQTGIDLSDESNLHFVAGIIRPPEIILTFHNKPQALLFYRKKDGEYQKIDIVKNNSDENAEEKNLLFSQIIQGKISPWDYLLVASPHISDYFSQDRLQKIISTRSPEESAGHLEKVLTELRNGLSFGGLIIHPTTTAESFAPNAQLPQEKTAKVNKLFITEQNTAQTLAPSFTNSMGQKIQAWQKSVNPEFSTSQAKNRGEQTSKQKNNTEQIGTILRLSISYLVKLILLATAFFLSVIRLTNKAIKTAFYLITNFRNKRKIIINDYVLLWKNYRQAYEQLPNITKWLLWSSAVVLIGILTGIMVLNANRKATAQEKAFNITLGQLNEAVEAAESSLVYNNNKAALEQINFAERILQQLQCDIKKFKTACQNTKEKILTIAKKTRKITEVEPQLLLNLSSDDEKSTFIQAMRVANKILLFGHGQPIIYDLMTKTTSMLNIGYDDINFISGSVPKENDYALLLTDNNQLLIFNPTDNSIKKGEVGLPAEVKISAISVYNRRLYSLDAAHNQIYKHDSIKTGFGPGKIWLTTNTGLTNAVSMTVEGDLFILTDKGGINKFTKGEAQTFSIQDLDPTLNSGNKIWSYNDIKNIYILDSADKRLVIIDKTGQLQAQITSAKFNNPTDMIVDEINKSAYILDNNNLFQIPLP